MKKPLAKLIQTSLLTAVLYIPAIASPALAATPATDTIVLAGGCFWGVESVFDHTSGVTSVVSGYAGGQAETAHYQMVSGGNTGHAESVQVTYDLQKISLSQLLDIYFIVAHNPTELDYQGPDHGKQYRSAVFVSTPEQETAVKSKISELSSTHKYSEPIVTSVEPLKGFFPAEDYHQHYADLHPYNPYILFNDKPKLAELKKDYPAIYKD